MDTRDYTALQNKILRDMYSEKKSDICNPELPFGETTVMGDTLTWDGNTDGLYSVNSAFYKISDAIPTVEDFQNGGSYTFAGTETYFKSSDVIDVSAYGMGSDALIIFTNADAYYVAIALTDGATVNLNGSTFTIEKAGTYLLNNSYFEVAVKGYVSKLTINGYKGFPTTEITPLPNKYLDFIETVGSDTLTWDGNIKGLEVGTFDNPDTGTWGMFRISEATPTVDELLKGIVVVLNNGEIVNITTDEYIFNIDGKVVDVDGWFYIAYEDNTIVKDANVTFNMPKKGIYVMTGDGCDIVSFKINNYTGFPKEQVKEEYLSSGGYMFEYDTDTNRHNGDFAKVNAAVFSCYPVYVIRNDAIFLADCIGLENGKAVNLQCSGMGTMQFLETGGVYDD